ncbi:hypothetical protein AAFF_G00042740 [Aldrovandia affinis]|uniref:Uncharacterized protein n=1 Tax=Aldrovandia affinis TaxID=143900 RepID=A0AAD7R472_9TELE|nr:hypothetical protein AAFF_G00042740 [Aldrovandia affinis]
MIGDSLQNVIIQATKTVHDVEGSNVTLSCNYTGSASGWSDIHSSLAPGAASSHSAAAINAEENHTGETKAERKPTPSGLAGGCYPGDIHG